jgi:predicted amidohydrolase YtcJ
MALNAYEYAGKSTFASDDPRFRIEHIETVAAADIPRFKKLDVLASMQPIHADPGTSDVWSRAVGPERLKRAFAWRELQKAGARLVYGSDWPACINVNPWRGIHVAVNRQTPEGHPPGGWVPEQRVTLEAALEAYTRAGAFASHERNLKGTFAPGRLADIIVLDRDPFRISPSDLYKVRAVMTFLDGKVIYDAR